MRCAVIGAGAWGTALADLLADNGHETMIWALEPDVADVDQRAGTRTRASSAVCRCSRKLRAPSNDHADAIRGAELIVYATPCSICGAIARWRASCVAPGATLVVATKGIERGTLALMTT